MLSVSKRGTAPRYRGLARGAKDGRCILQGALVEGTGQRIAKNVTRNHLLMVDYDTGHSVDEIAAAIVKRGLFALLWTTHSHLKCETLIAENELVKRAGSLAAVTVDVARAYLADVKKYKAEIAASVSGCERDHVEGGISSRSTRTDATRPRALRARRALRLRQAGRHTSRSDRRMERALRGAVHVARPAVG